MNTKYNDRVEAGEILAENLKDFDLHNAIVLGLPRGGVPIAARIAQRYNIPLDVIIAHKLGAPGNPEAAIGAVAEDQALFFDQYIDYYSLPDTYLEREIAYQQSEINRRVQLYRNGKPFSQLNLTGKTVIVVDDGIATGDTLQAALNAIKNQYPARIIVAVPVAPPEIVQNLEALQYEVVCPLQPESLKAVGLWYKDFSPVDDALVIALLDQTRQEKK